MRILIVVLAVLVGSVGCSGDDGPAVTAADDDTADTTGSTTTTTVVEDPSAGAEEYMRALASNDPRTMLEMADQAQRGSPARAYAVHQQAIAEALTQGAAPAPDPIEVTEDTVVLTSTDENGQTHDTTYGDFEVDPDTGKLVTFTVNGTPIDDRITLGGRPVTAQGITVAPFSAYQSVESDTLFIVVDVANDSGQIFNNAPHSASYVGPDGTQTEVDGSDGPSDIQQGATARSVMLFPRSPLGGELFYTGFLNDFVTEVNITVPIPAT